MDKDLKPGAIIASRFVLDRRLGSGGMGVVWSASVQGETSRFALKFLRGDRPHNERVLQRFLQEAHATRKINHPGVVQIHDVVEDGQGLPVLVMDLLEGETLAARLERGGPMKAADALRLLMPAASAVAAAHDERVIHRDLKPENLFLSVEDDGSVQIRVLDFGIAKVMRDPDGSRSGLMTSTGVVMGTPFYMAPEQLFSEGEIDERADVWAFGVILYECIAGRRPFVGPSVGQVLRLIALDEYTPLAIAAPGSEPPICDLVTRLLARERSRRPRTMREVERLLRTVLDGTYEFSLPFAETVEISPAAHTLVDRAATPSSGQLRGFERPVTGATTDPLRPGQSAEMRLPITSRRGMALGVLALAVLVALGVFQLRASQSSAPEPTPVRFVPEGNASAAPPPPSSASAPKVAPSAGPRPAEPLPVASQVAPPPQVAPRRPPLRADSSAPPQAAQSAHTPPPPPAPQASGEAARRPGSVVDVPPF